VDEFTLTLHKLKATRAKQEARVETLKASKQHVESLSGALQAAVASARTRSAAIEESVARPHDAERTPAQQAETSQWYHDLTHGGFVIKPPAIPEATPQWYTQAESETLQHFATASSAHQRQVLRALGVHIVLQADEGQSPSGRRKYRTGDVRLRYDLALGGESGEASGKATGEEQTTVQTTPPVK
jgi:predicted transcriptional regulator